MRKVSSKVVQLSYDHESSARDLVIIQREIPSDYSFSDLREALEDITYEWDTYYYMPRLWGGHDCDGSTFTTRYRTISKKIEHGVRGAGYDSRNECSDLDTSRLFVEVIIEHDTSINI